MSVIGDASFKGSPDENGMIEIGYGLIEEERKKGYCFEAVDGLLK
ncbi:MAG: GNAT family N-acetyltransferase [Firmicutes bacterium]|nr:GNAT family N-acetyltransferase [Bacillota bacterium]